MQNTAQTTYTIPQALEIGLAHYQAGRMDDAEAVCSKILSVQPDNAFALHLIGAVANQRGHYDRAIDIIGKSVAIEATNAAALNNLGWAYRMTGRLGDAARCFQTVLAMHPDSALVHNNLGCVFTDQKNANAAMACYQKAVALDPAYADAHGNVGTTYYHLANFPGALEHFKKSLSIDPGHNTALIGALEAQSRMTPMSGWLAFCDETLSLPLTNDNRFIALVFRAIAEWATGADTALGGTLSEIEAIMPADTGGPLKNFAHFHGFVSALCRYKKDNAALYDASGPEIFIVGDSHSLSYSGTKMTRDGTDYKISPHLIFGAKAWHMSGGKNIFNATFDIILDRIAPGSLLLLSFGEIDCREDEGILRYWKKTGDSLTDLVSAQVAQYVSTMAEKTEKKNLKLIFLSVPAPVTSSTERREVVALFNAALEKNVRAGGHQYIDIYAPTVSKDGSSNGRLHIDHYHLKPEALRLAE